MGDEKTGRRIWDENGDYIQAHSIQWYAAYAAREDALESIMELPDQTLADVMFEIVEERERRGVSDLAKLRNEILNDLPFLDEIAMTYKPATDDPAKAVAIGAHWAYRRFLNLIDDLQGRT